MPHPISAAPRDPTRDIAFDLVSAVLDRHRSLDDALDASGGADEPRDRAAAHRLAASVLRRLGTLDAMLEPFMRRAPPVPVRHILRLGAAGLLLLETPAHAAVGTAVDLTRARKMAPFASFVNAVLRKVAQAGPASLDGLDGPRLDTPSWMWASWGAEARVIAEAHAVEAPLDLTLRHGSARDGSALAGADMPEGAVVLPTGSVRLPAGTRVLEVPGFEDGAFWVQDAAATLPARLLAAQPGERVADLCAAPGGKTAQLAMTGAQVTAVDRDAGRLRRLHENLARLRMEVQVVEADAATWAPDGLLDAVLLDAPCSATGTIRRHPDALRLKFPTDLAALAAGQDRLLEAAAGMLRPGGRLIYATCSLQREEGAARVAEPGRFGLRADPFTAAELAVLPEALTSEGYLRTHPGMWAGQGGMDGFFAARLVRE